MTNPLFTREGKAFTARPSINDRDQLGYWITSRMCNRCGGAGGADKWKFTGWACFECGGKGKVPCERFARLYTADELAKLNARVAKAEATREAKRQARQAAEAARVAAERDAIIADHQEILDRIAAVIDTNGEGFLCDMFQQVTIRARPLSEKQIEAAANACARIEAEIARKTAATYVGTIGERVTLNLTLVRTYDISETWYGAPARWIWTFRDDNGNTVVYIGGKCVAFGSACEKGDTCRIVATVKDHKDYRGEPQTVIQRPKAA